MYFCLLCNTKFYSIEVRSGEKNKLVENFNEILNTTYTSLNLLDNSIMDITDKLVSYFNFNVMQMINKFHEGYSILDINTNTYCYFKYSIL